MGLPTKVSTLNPKACSVIELYGFLDLATRDWTDGLLSNIFREMNKPTDKKERRYILYDGDVDALWIENMVRHFLANVVPIEHLRCYLEFCHGRQQTVDFSQR